MTESITTPQYLPWYVATYSDGQKALVNALGDVICVTQGAARWQDERDLNAILEAIND